MAPIHGPAINTHTCPKAVTSPAIPLTMAGPKLLAGLTLVPVNGIPKR